MKDLKTLPEVLDLSNFKQTELFRGQDEYRNGKTRSLPLTRAAMLNTPLLSTLSGTPSQDGIFRIANVNYYLEVRNALYDEPILVIGFPFDPNLLQIDTPQNIQITHTLNSTFREVAQNNGRIITIQGQSGYEERLGFARDGGYCFENGEILMEEFEEFLNNYNYLLFKTSNSLFRNFSGKGLHHTNIQQGNIIHSGYKSVIKGQNKYFMTLRCVRENITYKVEPIDFSINKDAARNKFGYVYSLKLIAYGIYGQGKRSNIFKDILDNVAAYIRLAALAAAFAQSVVENVNQDYINPIKEPLRAINTSLSKIEDLIGTAGAVTNNAISIISEIRQTVVNLSYIFKENGRIAKSLNSSFGNISAQFNATKFEGWNADKLNQNTSNAFKGNRLPTERTLDDLENEPFPPQSYGLRVRQNATVKEQKDLSKTLDMLNDFDLSNKTEDEFNNLGILQASLNSMFYNLENLFSLVPLDFEPSQIDTQNNGFERINFRALNENDEGLFNIYRLKEGENLYSVARKVLGTPNDIGILIDANGWLDGYRRGDGSLCSQGDIIKIPINDLSLIFANDGIGVDLSCPMNTLSLDIDRNDLNLSIAQNNLEQALKNYFLIHAGELRTALNVGCAGVIGAKNLEYVKSVITEKLLSDERIKNLVFNDIYSTSDSVIINLTVDPINRQQINLRTQISI